MLSIIEIVLPVFLVVGAGYIALKREILPEPTGDILMKFTQTFAIPCLLFLALYRLDFTAFFDLKLIISFYTGALTCFALGVLVARKVFKRRPGESIAIGFGALFSNSVLLGLPITERAYGVDALGPTYLLIALHTPICFLVGITAMEISRADGRSAGETARVTLVAMFKNTVTLACFAGVVLNLGGVPMPSALVDAMDMLARAGLPAALFALGAVLSQYRFRAALGEASAITAISLIIHPAIVYLLAVETFALSDEFVRSAVLMAAMAPGVNAYVFASMYDRAKGEAATTVVLSTTVSILTTTGWLLILGGASIG